MWKISNRVTFSNESVSSTNQAVTFVQTRVSLHPMFEISVSSPGTVKWKIPKEFFVDPYALSHEKKAIYTCHKECSWFPILVPWTLKGTIDLESRSSNLNQTLYIPLTSMARVTLHARVPDACESGYLDLKLSSNFIQIPCGLIQDTQWVVEATNSIVICGLLVVIFMFIQGRRHDLALSNTSRRILESGSSSRT